MQTWRCGNCGYQYEGNFLEACPSCKKSCAFVDASNYVPKSFISIEEKSIYKGENIMEKVKIYCAPFCPSCKDVVKFLKKKGVSFDLIDVDSDEDARQEAISISGQEKIPVLVVGKEVIVAPTNKAELKTMLEQRFG